MEKRGENEHANRLRVTLVTAKNTNCCWMRVYACTRETCEKGTDDEQREKKKIKVPPKRGNKMAREMKQKGNQRKKERKKDKVRRKQKMDNKYSPLMPHHTKTTHLLNNQMKPVRILMTDWG